MTREEAIETIKTAIAEVEWEYPMNYAVAFEVAIKALKEQARWIPISERLPEESIKQIMLGDEHTSDFVLVTIKGQTYPFPKAKVKVARYSYTHKAWQIANNNFGKVVAWMPLPEPYKTESEAN